MEEGWIKLHRSLMDNKLWKEKPFTRGQAWVDLLLLANHADRKIYRADQVDICKRGETIITERNLAKRWGWSRSKITRYLKLLKNDSMIERKPDRITILNYDSYQSERTKSEPRVNQERTKSEPKVNHNKNVKNVKNEKNNILCEAEASLFESFRKAYPGRKPGHHESAKTLKKHRDWKAVLPKLKEGLDREIEWRRKATLAGIFVPQWKNLKTWLNQRCWEDEFDELPAYYEPTEKKHHTYEPEYLQIPENERLNIESDILNELEPKFPADVQSYRLGDPAHYFKEQIMRRVIRRHNETR